MHRHQRLHLAARADTGAGDADPGGRQPFLIERHRGGHHGRRHDPPARAHGGDHSGPGCGSWREVDADSERVWLLKGGD